MFGIPRLEKKCLGESVPRRGQTALPSCLMALPGPLSRNSRNNAAERGADRKVPAGGHREGRARSKRQVVPATEWAWRFDVPMSGTMHTRGEVDDIGGGGGHAKKCGKIAGGDVEIVAIAEMATPPSHRCW